MFPAELVNNFERILSGEPPLDLNPPKTPTNLQFHFHSKKFFKYLFRKIKSKEEKRVKLIKTKSIDYPYFIFHDSKYP